MDTLYSYCAKVCRVECHGTEGGAAASYRHGVLLRPEFRFSSRRQKFSNFGSLRLVDAKLNQPVSRVSSVSSNRNAEVDLETIESGNEETFPSETVQVRFLLKKECLFGEQFFLVGDDPVLGSWDPSSAIPMNWSEGHVWTVDLDIPIGNEIQFKFILKRHTGDIEWQPDPDRTIKIWETKHIITVCEDWEDADVQEIIEAETFIDTFEELPDKIETLIVAEHPSPQPMEKVVPETESESAFTDVHTASDDNPFPEADESSVVDKVAPQHEKPLAIVADNITEPKEKSVESSVNSIHSERSIASDENDGVILNREIVMSEDVHGNNRIGGNIDSSEGPVLVPGLSPFSMVLTEEPSELEVERISRPDVPAGTEEIITDAKVPELDEIQEPDASAHHEEAAVSVINFVEKKELIDKQNQRPQEPGMDACHAAATLVEQEEWLINEKNQLPQLETAEEEHDDEPAEVDNVISSDIQLPQFETAEEEHDDERAEVDNVVSSDIQWGRKTLQNFLTNLGFLL